MTMTGNRWQEKNYTDISEILSVYASIKCILAFFSGHVFSVVVSRWWCAAALTWFSSWETSSRHWKWFTRNTWTTRTSPSACECKHLSHLLYWMINIQEYKENIYFFFYKLQNIFLCLHHLSAPLWSSSSRVFIDDEESFWLQILVYWLLCKKSCFVSVGTLHCF